MLLNTAQLLSLHQVARATAEIRDYFTVWHCRMCRAERHSVINMYPPYRFIKEWPPHPHTCVRCDGLKSDSDNLA